MPDDFIAKLTPDDEGVLVRFLIWLFGVHWKTSLSGILSLCMASFGVITSGLAPLAALNPGSNFAKYSAISAAVGTIVSGLGKAWVGLLMQDNGVQSVKLPDVAEPVSVPSHETPNMPLPKGAQIVTKGE